jgi:hypothetical protein
MVIDHSTTTAKAAGHSGGKRGKGGDILYRWGNPKNYGRGTSADQKLFQQHNAKWIKTGLPRQGDVMVFNNGVGRPGPTYSSVEIIKLPLLSDSSYDMVPMQPYGPSSSYWAYPAQPDTTFYSATMGSAQMQPNGNILICEASTGALTEVDSSGTEVWRYVSPLIPSGALSQNSTGNNGVFEIKRYSNEFPGLLAHVLTPGLPVELNPLPYNCTIFPTVGIPDISQGINFRISPNPAHTRLTVIMNTQYAQRWSVQLRDVTGRIAVSREYYSYPGLNSYALDVSALPKGVYLLQLTSSRNKDQRTVVIE